MIEDYLKAGYPALWIQTHEEQRAISTMEKQLQGYHIYSWDLVDGLHDHQTGQKRQMPDPLKPLQTILSLPESSVVFLKDFHRFVQAVEIVRTIKNILPVLKATDKHIIMVSPVVDIPVELEKDITYKNFPLPDVKEMLEVAHRIVKENGLNVTVDEKAITAGKGLTLHEAENAMALSLVKEKMYSKKVLEQEKLQAVRKSGLMELQNPEPIESLGGLENLKRYLQNRKSGFYNNNIPTYAKPHGIILVGPPGTGKSLSAKVCASIFDIPLIRLDISSLKGSLVGESEKNMNQALQLIRSVSPVVVWMDEFEKAFAGVASSARTDGGTTLGIMGRLMTAMQDFRDEGVPVYWVATVNDIDALIENSQGAMIRRFDDVFFVDFPSVEERRDIINIMNKKYSTQIPPEWAEKMDNWTGAEIEKLAFSSLYDGIDEAFRSIKPIYHQCQSSIERVRDWAQYNARNANKKNNEYNESPFKTARTVRAVKTVQTV